MPESEQLLVKVIGERNSGTNFLETVLIANFSVTLAANAAGVPKAFESALPGYLDGGWRSRRGTKEALQDHAHILGMETCGGWKHSAATEKLALFQAQRGAKIVFIVRHPLTWARAMHRNPFHGIARVPRSFEAFLQAPWVLLGRDELPDRALHSVLDLSIAKTATYVEFTKQYANSYLLRYEDVILSADKVLSALDLPKTV